MKQLFALILSVFCLSMLNAAPTKKGTLKKASFDFDNEKKVENSHKGLMSLLPCTRTSTQSATQTWPGCNGGTVTISATYTCTATGSSCDDALFAAVQCAYISAWSYVSSQEPVCPPE